MTRVTAEQVRRVMDAPPYWLSGSYLPAYRDGRLSVEVLAYAVTAALSYSPYNGEVVDEVAAILRERFGDYGAAAALFV